MEFIRALSEKKCLLERRIHTQVTNALDKIAYDIPNDVIANTSNYSQVKEAFNVAYVNLGLIEHSITSILTPIITSTNQVIPVISANVHSTVLPSNLSAVVIQTETNRAIKEEPVEENVSVCPVAISNQDKQIVTVSDGVVKEKQTLESTVVTNAASEQQDQLTVESLMDRFYQTHLTSIEIVTVTPGDVKEEPTEENTVQQVATITTRPQTEEQQPFVSLEPIQDSNENIIVQPTVQKEQILDISTPAETEPTANIEQTNVRRSGRVSRKRRLSLSTEPEPQSKNTRRSAPAQSTAAILPITVLRSQGTLWVCPECGKQLTRGDELTRHVRTHTGEKPFRCIWTGCGMSASDRSNMVRHVRVVHFNLPLTKKELLERGNVDERRERDYFIVV